MVKKTKFFRTVSNLNETLHLSNWVNTVITDDSETRFDSISVTHIGGTVRALKQQLQFDSTVFIIQFMRGSQGKGSAAKTVSLGITMTIMAPSDYEVRMIGHS